VAFEVGPAVVTKEDGDGVVIHARLMQCVGDVAARGKAKE
jgi:hypothetical protein